MTFNPLLHGGFVLSVSTKLGRFGPAKIRCDCTWFAGHVATTQGPIRPPSHITWPTLNDYWRPSKLGWE